MSDSSDGTDCCTGVAEWNSNTNICGECIGNGIASVATDGSDCCSGVGQFNSVNGKCGDCVGVGGTSANNTGDDCCATENYDSATNTCTS